MRAGSHKCDICHIEFASSQELADHQVVEHNNVTYHCKSCGSYFDDREKLEAHKIKIHGNKTQPAAEETGLATENDDMQSLLLKRHAEEQKARKRTRGPYRKSSAA